MLVQTNLVKKEDIIVEGNTKIQLEKKLSDCYKRQSDLKNGIPKVLWTKAVSWMHTAKYMGYHSVRINGTLVSYKERCSCTRFDIE